MSAESFYRKYRSQTFDQIVGQEHIKQTLSNAITNDRLSHAYIFSGPRGTGKTSMARILAKSINCRTGKGVAPCLTCDLCTGITQGSSVDVIEIDAASNTGVDNIRELNEKINFMPVECEYKIYIIDEVHMLSMGAFNALLKTLEEPPSKTIFILATTEAHKIPVTIHSRCQQLHFRNLSLDEIKTHLDFIAKEESIELEDKCLTAIARNSGGCMRDGLSLFNQIYSFKGNKITYGDVLFILGSTEDHHLIAFLTHVFAKDDAKAIAALQTFINDGANVTQVITDILAVLRRVMLIKLKLKNEIDCDELTLLACEKLAASIDLDSLKEALDTYAQTEIDLRWFSKPDLLLQVRSLNLMKTKTAELRSVIPVTPVTSTAPVQTPVQTQGATPKAVFQKPVAAAPIQSTASTLPHLRKKVPQQSPTPIPAVVAPQEKVAKRGAPSPASEGPTGSVDNETWDNLVTALKAERAALYSVLRQSRIAQVSDTSITVALKQDFKFFREKLKEQGNKDVLHKMIEKYFGKRLNFFLPGEDGAPQAPGQTVQDRAPQSAFSTPANDNQRINEIVTMFEGSIV